MGNVGETLHLLDCGSSGDSGDSGVLVGLVPLFYFNLSSKTHPPFLDQYIISHKEAELLLCQSPYKA